MARPALAGGASAVSRQLRPARAGCRWRPGPFPWPPGPRAGAVPPRGSAGRAPATGGRSRPGRSSRRGCRRGCKRAPGRGPAGTGAGRAVSPWLTGAIYGVGRTPLHGHGVQAKDQKRVDKFLVHMLHLGEGEGASKVSPENPRAGPDRRHPLQRILEKREIIYAHCPRGTGVKQPNSRRLLLFGETRCQAGQPRLR